LTAEDRAKYIESIIETEKTRQLNGGAQPISDFDKTRLSANIGILIYEGLAANARATTDLTAALGKASDDLRAASRDSSNTARQLKNYTVVLAFATGLLVLPASGRLMKPTRPTNTEPRINRLHELTLRHRLSNRRLRVLLSPPGQPNKLHSLSLRRRIITNSNSVQFIEHQILGSSRF
jgi:hypothetical protein